MGWYDNINNTEYSKIEDKNTNGPTNIVDPGAAEKETENNDKEKEQKKGGEGGGYQMEHNKIFLISISIHFVCLFWDNRGAASIVVDHNKAKNFWLMRTSWVVFVWWL